MGRLDQLFARSHLTKDMCIQINLRRRVAAAILPVVALWATGVCAGIPIPGVPEEDEPVRNRNSHIGISLGLSSSPDVVSDVFGSAADALLYVDHRVYKWLGVRGAYGSISLGSANPEADLETYLAAFDLFGASFRNVSLSFDYVAVGPSVRFHFGERHSLMGALSYVFYEVKVDLASLEAHRLTPSNSRSGINADVVYGFWIGNSWGIHARFEWHQIRTTADPDDLYHAFARGDTNPRFYSFLLGVQLGYR